MEEPTHRYIDKFPQRLRQLREQRGMDRKTLGECCGLSKNAITRYERGERVPDINIAMAIADFFEITLDELCGRKKFFSRPPIGGRR